MTRHANAAAVGADDTLRDAVRAAVRAAVRPSDRVVLAVSGGRDSMVLLDAFARWRRAAIVAVATFDHGTGVAATQAAALVEVVARELRLPFARGRARRLAKRESAWRAARWEFLTETAETLAARVATAHTEDDQVETVFLRAMRDAGPRGLAALYAASDIMRPLLTVARDDVAAYASSRAVQYVDDPSNDSRRFFRNRVRLDLLPAAERVRPGFRNELLALARRAAVLRGDVERYVDELAPRREGRSVFVDAAPLLALERDGRAVLWPALAARAGVVLDRRGTTRLAAFTTRTRRTNRVQLAGGHEVVRHATTFEVRPGSAEREP